DSNALFDNWRQPFQHSAGAKGNSFTWDAETIKEDDRVSSLRSIAGYRFLDLRLGPPVDKVRRGCVASSAVTEVVRADRSHLVGRYSACRNGGSHKHAVAGLDYQNAFLRHTIHLQQCFMWR